MIPVFFAFPQLFAGDGLGLANQAGEVTGCELERPKDRVIGRSSGCDTAKRD